MAYRSTARQLSLTLWRSRNNLLALLLVFASAHGVRAEHNLIRPPGTTRYAPMVDRLNAMLSWDHEAGHRRMTLASIGSSVEGRSIWMVTLHDPSADEAGKKVFYLCRQHGHEPASTEGALDFVDELVHADPASDLGRCLTKTTVYIVPMANPDGAEHYLRHNAHDVDINRDWLTRTQPETRALWAAIDRIHPDLLTDQHELYPTDHRPDFTETAGPKAGAPESTLATCLAVQPVVHLALVADGFPNRSCQIDTFHRPRLAHKFGCTIAGIPTILFETNRSDPHRTVADRAQAHQQFMRIMLREAAGEGTELLAEADAVLGRNPLPPSTPMQSSGEDREGQ